jgi:hypothetical protein
LLAARPPTTPITDFVSRWQQFDSGALPTTTNETPTQGAVIPVYDEAGNVIETQEQREFKEP